MNLIGKQRIPSKVNESVHFTIRALNTIQRAKRDLSLLTEKAKMRDLITKRNEILEKIYGPETDEAKRAELYKNAPPEAVAENNRMYEEAETIGGTTIIPATIRAGLVKVEGLTIDGVPIVDAEAFIDNAPDALIDEAYKLCSEASALDSDARKN